MALKVVPEAWSSKRLEKDRIRAIQVFVERRLREGDPDYLKHFSESQAMIEEFLSLSGNLLDLDVGKFLDRVSLIEDIARFTTGPPVSADDFKTILGLRRIRAGATAEVEQALAMIRGLIDSTRFGWVSRRKVPSPEERRAAVVATASLRAVERARTGRRSSEQVRQENFVADRLRKMNLKEIATVKHPDRDMPEGSFKRGVNFESKQCDLLIRLYDERFLAIECKSSNSAVNSIKRLNDVFEKAQVWRVQRGAKVVTAAVVAGVFDLKSLETAQEKGVYLVWEHDLTPLKDYITATKKST